ncbi:MAG TPA: alkaline phosphatase family protein [Acidobacteriaceae bacterium]|nr:alkaline phosphatase family protein [Acidobacteriaceae bacterium]
MTTSTAASGSANDSPAQTTTYTAVATGSGGSATQTTTVQVVQPVTPQITSFTADPTTVNAGQSTTLSWQTTNATSVAISPAPQQSDTAGALSTSGSVSTPVSQTTTFTLTATGPGGSATQSVTVTVPITLSFTVSPQTITAGQSVTLSWQVSGGTASSLNIDNGVCNSCTLPQGTATDSPPATTTYTATATVSGGTQVTQAATVTVTAATPGTLKHIFVMVQENRAFDMYFGQLGAYRANRLAQAGITDSQTVDGFDPTVTLTNHNTGAQVQPFHEATVCTENLSPSWDESHHDLALAGGDPAWVTTTTYTDSSFAMNNFLDTTDSVPESYDPDGTRALGYYNQTDLPYYYDLASFFATSDDWHSPVLAGTIPNRMYLMAATSFGHEYADSTGHPLYSAETIFRAMNNANVSWLYYYKDGVFLANFADWSDPTIQTKVFPVSDLFNRLSGTCSGAPCDPDKALPEVIFIDGASGASHLDEHPGNNIQSGAAYVESIITALMNSDAWKDSAFILTYDEGGGLYDHVPPFMVPPPDNYAPGQCPDPNNGTAIYCATGKLGGTFNLTGFRVPLIVISPYAKPHYVSHTPLGSTAILAFIEKTFNVPPLTQRDAYWLQSGDMSEFFDFSNANLLTAPGGAAWPQYLATQPTNGLCDQTHESSSFAASP